MEPDLHLLVEVLHLAQVLEADRRRQEPDRSKETGGSSRQPLGRRRATSSGLGGNEPQQQRVAHLAEMVQERPHLDDELERFRRLARLLKEVDGHLADLGRRVVQLRDEQLQRPLVDLIGREDEVAEALRRVQPDVLRGGGGQADQPLGAGERRAGERTM